MKFLRSRYLLIGVLAGLLTGGGWLAYAAIQSQVGLNSLDGTSGSWIPNCRQIMNDADGANRATIPPFNCGIMDVDSALWYKGTTTLLNAARDVTGISDGGSTGIGAQGIVGFNGTTWDRLRSAPNNADSLPTSTLGNLQTSSVPLLFNGASFDRARGDVNGQFIHGVALNGTTIGTNNRPVLIGGSDGVAVRSLQTAASAILTASTTAGTLAVAPITQWSLTNGPAAGAQATASKAAGGGTVRHVATSIDACIADNTAAAAAIRINLRDGATGAGTIIRQWLLGTSALDASQCFHADGFSIIGSANTAITIEFAAAGAATTLETVNLSGYSVP
jgi:hypothetical protein